ncbi:MAG: hypothetical protein GZ093_06840 [Rhodoferax sp.]|uniref:hypothetical protein n=1 Tax=Rhodoferax sp. TaxID=50421 RepID=UPI001401685E|nr:hypothetical protein [Rhodoferax sp.]NDP38454.1 hypothetical protein [Rhodoferax sp.]
MGNEDCKQQEGRQPAFFQSVLGFDINQNIPSPPEETFIIPSVVKKTADRRMPGIAAITHQRKLAEYESDRNVQLRDRGPRGFL